MTMLSQPSLKLCAYIICRSHPRPPPPPAPPPSHRAPANDTPGEEETEARGGRCRSSVIPVLWPNLTTSSNNETKRDETEILPETRMLTRKWTVLNWQIMGPAVARSVTNHCPDLLHHVLRFLWIQQISSMRSSSVLFFHLQTMNRLWVSCRVGCTTIMAFLSFFFFFCLLQEALTFTL